MSRLTERELELIRRERLAAEREIGPQRHAGGEAGFLITQIIDPIRRSLSRRRTILELSRLDDRMLQDIGLSRGSLETVADALTGAGSAKLRAAAPRREHGLLAGLRRWSRRQAAIQQLSALDDRVLQDIGVLRGEIAELVDRAMAAEDAVPASVDALLRATQVSVPQARQPLNAHPASLNAKAMAERALQVASHRQAS